MWEKCYFDKEILNISSEINHQDLLERLLYAPLLGGSLGQMHSHTHTQAQIVLNCDWGKIKWLNGWIYCQPMKGLKPQICSVCSPPMEELVSA